MDPRLFWHLIPRSTVQITESVCLALLSQWSACQLDANTATDSAFLLAGRGLGKASVWIFYWSVTSLQLSVLTSYSVLNHSWDYWCIDPLIPDLDCIILTGNAPLASLQENCIFQWHTIKGIPFISQGHHMHDLTWATFIYTLNSWQPARQSFFCSSPLCRKKKTKQQTGQMLFKHFILNMLQQPCVKCQIRMQQSANHLKLYSMEV